jgi:RNA polymerase sigma-70 factor (ECF subfamily)
LDIEQALLQRAQALEERALTEIFDTYYLPLYRYIYHHVGHVATAEDLTAEVFHRLLAKLHAGRGPRKRLKPWLFRVAHSIVVDEARRQMHRNHQSLDERLPADAPPVDEQAQQSILSAEARRALRELTPKQRSVIVLKFLFGMDNAEVAQILTLPVGAVKALQHRGLAALRRKLSRTAWAMDGETP